MLLNEFRADKKDGYCEKCYFKEREKALKDYELEESDLKNEILRLVDSIPIISSQSPMDWEYETVGIVTGQSVMGTGFFTELSSGV